jgi:hypothetical protein
LSITSHAKWFPVVIVISPAEPRYSPIEFEFGSALKILPLPLMYTNLVAKSFELWDSASLSSFLTIETAVSDIIGIRLSDGTFVETCNAIYTIIIVVMPTVIDVDSLAIFLFNFF